MATRRNNLQTRGFVYVVEFERGCKIGFTTDPPARFDRLRRDEGGGDDYHVWLLLRGTLRDERRLQRKWAEQRIAGEWYETTDDLLRWAEQQHDYGSLRRIEDDLLVQARERA